MARALRARQLGAACCGFSVRGTTGYGFFGAASLVSFGVEAGEPGETTAEPDLLPGKPGTLLWSCICVVLVSGRGVLLPEDPVAAGPDLFPGRPGMPGLETPPAPGVVCSLVCPEDCPAAAGCAELLCDHAGNAVPSTMIAAALKIGFTVILPSLATFRGHPSII
jgi:hypothetical protein